MNPLSNNSELNEIESKLLAAAAEADSKGIPITVDAMGGDNPKAGEPKPSESKGGEPKAGEPKPIEPKGGEPKAGEPKPSEPKGGETKAGEPKPSEPKGGEPKAGEPKSGEPKSAYEKEKERHRRSWEELERQKQALAKEREAIEMEKRELAKAKEIKTREKTFDDYTAEDFEKMAQDYEADGRDDLAQAARNRAKRLREAEEQQRQQSLETFRVNYLNQRKEIWDQVVKDNPTLNDAESPLSKRANNYWQQYVDMAQQMSSIPHPAMTKFVVDYAKAKLAEESMPEMVAKVEKLEAEIKRLQGELEISGGNPTIKTKPRFEQLSREEQEREILQSAMAADAQLLME